MGKSYKGLTYNVEVYLKMQEIKKLFEGVDTSKIIICTRGVGENENTSRHVEGKYDKKRRCWH